MDDLDNIVGNIANAGPYAAVAGLDDNADDAARSMQLSRMTGIDPRVINADLPGFEREHKQSLVMSALRNDSQLNQFIAQHPLGGSIANDDYGNLSIFGRAMNRLHEHLDPLNIGGGIVRGAIEGAEGGAASVPDFALEYQKMRQGEPWYEKPATGLNTALLLGLQGGASLLFGAMGAGMGAIQGAITTPIEKMYSQAGSTMPENLRRDIGGMLENTVMGGVGHAPEITEHAAVQARYSEAAKAAKPWIDAGVEPPKGIHPLIDELKTSANSEGVARLDEAATAAQQTLLRERDPESFKQFVEQYGNKSISIPAEVAESMYGDKAPAPDDGILGWVPDIDNKLAAARDVGADVHIPISDWLTWSTPELRQALRQDIRTWPGGITEREAAEPRVAPPTVDSPVAQIRGNSGLEPMYSWGDRKLALERWGTAEDHDYKLLDQDGNEAGLLSLTPIPEEKKLYVNAIYGGAGLNANAFGPSLMRDVLRQLKALYPDYETITGHRVTGAREAAGGDGFPVVKLEDEPANMKAQFENFNDIISRSYQRDISDRIAAYHPRPEDLNDTQRQIIQSVQEELQRLTPTATVSTPSMLLNRDTGRSPTGAFQQFPDRSPEIAVSLFSNNPIGTARHEAVHHLRQEGFIHEDEWKILRAESEKAGWVDKYNIDDRYKGLDSEAQHEEAIAEAFKEWAANPAGESKWHPVVEAVFQRLKEFWEALKPRLAGVFGREPTAEEIFAAMHSGEIGAREPSGPIHPEAFRETKLADETPATAEELQRQLDMLRASSVGLDQKSFERIQELIKAQHADDLAAAMKTAERQQTLRQSKEWKDAKAEFRKTAEETIRQRPDVAADLFVGSGEFNGNKLRQRIPLREADLTTAQRAVLPDHYYSKSGAPVDSVASMFGFGSGDEMVSALAGYNRIKAENDFTPQEMLKHVIDTEVDRQMSAKYGSLDANIASEAHAQAHSDATLNILADEYVAAAMQHGGDFVDKDIVRTAAKNVFANMKVSDIHYPSLTARTQRFADRATKQLLAGDAAGAVVSLQKRFASGVIASEALKFQREVEAFDKLADRFKSRVVKGVDPEYTNWIHDILSRIGKPVRRSLQDIGKQIEASPSKTLEDFINDKAGALREIPVYGQLLNPTWAKHLDDMTTFEYRAVRDSVKSLAFNARDEMRIQLGIDRMNLDDFKAELLDNLDRGEPINYDAEGKRVNFASNIPGIEAIRGFKTKSLDLENVFNRFDHFNAKGPWNRVIRQLIEGANRKTAWEKEFAEKLLDIKDDRDLNRSVNNTIFRDPTAGGAPFAFTRKNLLTVMLNTGTRSNLEKLARGYNLQPEQVMQWIHSVATKQDWDFVQKIWSNIFPEIKERGDNMYRSLSGGVAPDDVQVTPIKTPFGTYAGGYYPIIHHAKFEGNIAGRSKLMEPEYFKATTPNGWTKSRTGDVRPLSLSLDDMPGRINQMLHDIALRPAVLEASKIFYDKRIRESIRTNFGTEYRDMLEPYIESVSNSANRMTKADQSIETVSGFIRQNLVSTLIGFNPGTVLKHGPSAAITSMREVGPKEYLRATKSMFSIDEATGESNWKFAMDHSLELQRRDRNWGENLYGATNKLAGGTTVFGSGTKSEQFMKLREKVMSLGSKPVALSDMLSAVPTWLAAYNKAIDAKETKGDAIYLADRAVRRAHGSTSITSRTGVMRDYSPWVTSVYNFFSDIMNRQMETIWRSQEALGQANKSGWDKAKEAIPIMTAGAFAYAIWPALVEEMVSPTPNRDKNESWSWWATKGIAKTLSSSWVGVRDFTTMLMSGRDPQYGLVGTAWNEFGNVYRDMMDKKSPLAVQNQGRLIQDGASMIGTLTGMMPAQLGRSTRFLWNVDKGLERPQELPGVVTGLRFGTMKGHTQRWSQIGGKQ